MIGVLLVICRALLGWQGEKRKVRRSWSIEIDGLSMDFELSSIDKGLEIKELPQPQQEFIIH